MSAATVNAKPYPLTGLAGLLPSRLDCSSFSRLMRASRSLSRSSGACPLTARSLVIPSGAPCTAGSPDDRERVRMLSSAQTERVHGSACRWQALEKEPSAIRPCPRRRPSHVPHWRSIRAGQCEPAGRTQPVWRYRRGRTRSIRDRRRKRPRLGVAYCCAAERLARPAGASLLRRTGGISCEASPPPLPWPGRGDGAIPRRQTAGPRGPGTVFHAVRGPFFTRPGRGYFFSGFSFSRSASKT